MQIFGKEWQPAAETPQQFIVDQIRMGKVVPILSNSISNKLILGHHYQLIYKFASDFGYRAEDFKYALSNSYNLAHITQFLSVVRAKMGASGFLIIKRHYLNYVKSRLLDRAKDKGVLPRDLLAEVEDQSNALSFSKFASRLGYPEFGTVDQDPLLILASLDLPLYLTTGYHQCLEVALERVGKKPCMAICHWKRELEERPEVFTVDYQPIKDYQPSKEEPLVYHLHGLDAYPESLVLTEDDYLEFLVAVVRDKDRILGSVHQAITQSSLILLGYNLQDWDFRTLFWGLLKDRAVQHQSLSVLYLQLEPSEAERQYLQEYLEKAYFEVCWSDIHQYTKELYREIHR